MANGNIGKGRALMKMLEQHDLSSFIWRPKTLNCPSYGDQIFFVITLVAIENFPSPILW
jgi:hypothetical protein